jgi:hypothetical protein
MYTAWFLPLEGYHISHSPIADIFILPTMNPDGFAASKPSNTACGQYSGRENANYIDLNRNFPDRFDRHEGELQPETKVCLINHEVTVSTFVVDVFPSNRLVCQCFTRVNTLVPTGDDGLDFVEQLCVVSEPPWRVCGGMVRYVKFHCLSFGLIKIHFLCAMTSFFTNCLTSQLSV